MRRPRASGRHFLRFVGLGSLCARFGCLRVFLWALTFELRAPSGWRKFPTRLPQKPTPTSFPTSPFPQTLPPQNRRPPLTPHHSSHSHSQLHPPPPGLLFGVPSKALLRTPLSRWVNVPPTCALFMLLPRALLRAPCSKSSNSPANGPPLTPPPKKNPSANVQKPPIKRPPNFQDIALKTAANHSPKPAQKPKPPPKHGPKTVLLAPRYDGLLLDDKKAPKGGEGARRPGARPQGRPQEDRSGCGRGRACPSPLSKAFPSVSAAGGGASRNPRKKNRCPPLPCQTKPPTHLPESLAQSDVRIGPRRHCVGVHSDGAPLFLTVQARGPGVEGVFRGGLSS